MPTGTIQMLPAVDPALIPEHVGESLALTVLGCVREYFSVPEKMADYREWLIDYKRRKRAQRMEGGQ